MCAYVSFRSAIKKKNSYKKNKKKWYHTSRAGIWTVGICQLTKRFDPNPGVFISGNDLHAYKASTICTCYSGGGDGGGGNVNKGGGGKVNKGGGGKVKVIIECAIM